MVSSCFGSKGIMMASTLSSSSLMVSSRFGSSSMICSCCFSSSSELFSRLSWIGSSWSFSSELESYPLIESGASRASRVVFWCLLAFCFLCFDLLLCLVLQLTAGSALTGSSSFKPHALLKSLMFCAICFSYFFSSSRSFIILTARLRFFFILHCLIVSLMESFITIPTAKIMFKLIT